MVTKKTLCFACCLALGLALISGCGSKPVQSGEAKFSGEIKIGGNFELSGELAQFGIKGAKGAKLAVKQCNENGGIDGKKVQFFEIDNKSSQEGSAAAVQELIDINEVVGIIGPMTNQNTLAAVPVVTEKQVPLITPTATSPLITMDENGLHRWLFRACFIDAYQGEAAASFARDHLGADTAALLIDETAAYSKELAESFRLAFEAAGGKTVFSQTYTGGQDLDFTSILNKIKKKDVKVIFFPGFYREAALFVEQARQAGVFIPIIGGDGWGTGRLTQTASQEVLADTYYLEHCDLTDPALANFAAAYLTEYHEYADSFAVLGYDACRLLLNAIEKAQSTDKEKIRTALEETMDFQAASGIITIDPQTHNPRKSVAVLKFIDGKKAFEIRINPK